MTSSQLPQSFMHLMVCYRHEMTKQLSQTDLELSFTQVKALMVIHRVERCTPLDIANAAQLDKGQVTRILKDLIDKDVIYKAANASDKRSQIILLTDSGAQTVAKIEAIENTIIRQMSSGVTDADIAVFNKVAQDLSQNLTANCAS